MALRIKNTRDIKYYIYVSSAKLEMLYPQVAAQIKEKKAAEWKIDVKLLSYSAKTEKELADTQQARLDAVIENLDSNGQIGTPDEPREYFRATLPMRWGLYGEGGRPDSEPPLVYFGGRTENTVFGLGGSSRHVVGFRGATNTGSRSVTPYLVAHLLEGLGIPSEGWSAWGPREDTEYHTYEAILTANDYLRGPNLNMEFLAKTLLRGRTHHHLTGNEYKYILLGTPIYVAEVHPFAELNGSAELPAGESGVNP